MCTADWTEADQTVERVWYGTDGLAHAARVALAPAERLFAGLSGLRTLLYDAGWVKGTTPPIPVVSVGNLTVGGTGKTPVAAWIARWLHDHGARPAVIMRGYGNDEPAVHRELNPDVEVILDADRRRGVAEAGHRGADVAVLDDAFQHRQLKRTVDIVLISADRWWDEVHLLPAGPWREPLSALRRADLVIVTRKAATHDVVERVHTALSGIAPRVPRVSVHLAADDLVRVDGPGRAALSTLHGERVTVVAAIADPAAFVRQLEACGARVDPMVYRDHHDFDAADIDRIIASASGSGRVVCTLKDAVKLRNRWPRAAPTLWYVSQRVIVERGVGGIEQLLEAALRARHPENSPAHPGPV
jgi:tetraacyldisaccharide 4'-kinase